MSGESAQSSLGLPEWELVQIGERGSPIQYRPLTADQETRVPDYQEALGVAVTSKVASPPYSKYYVKEGIGPAGQPKYAAGNIEYGHLQGLHGEEVAVSVFRLNYPEYTGKVVLGLIAGEEGNLATPCGNCRDVLQTLTDNDPENLEIVSGADTGGLAIVSTLGDYLHEDYRTLDEAVVALDGISEGKVRRSVSLILNDMTPHTGAPDYDPPLPYDPYVPGDYERSDQVYTTALVTGRGYAYVGQLMTDAAYHPIYPMEHAILAAGRHYDVDHVVVASANPEGRPPRVMYRDRQQLYSFNQRQCDLRNQDLNPPVLLVNNYDPNDLRVWMTSVKEWLPLPFSADNFDGATRQEIAKYHQRIGVYREQPAS